MTLRHCSAIRSLLVLTSVSLLAFGCGQSTSDNRSPNAETNETQAAAASAAAEQARDRAEASEKAAVGDLGIEEQP